MTEININDDRGRAGAKALTVGTKLMGYFGGEPVPYGTDDRGRAGAKATWEGVFQCQQGALREGVFQCQQRGGIWDKVFHTEGHPVPKP